MSRVHGHRCSSSPREQGIAASTPSPNGSARHIRSPSRTHLNDDGWTTIPTRSVSTLPAHRRGESATNTKPPVAVLVTNDAVGSHSQAVVAVHDVRFQPGHQHIRHYLQLVRESRIIVKRPPKSAGAHLHTSAEDPVLMWARAAVAVHVDGVADTATVSSVQAIRDLVSAHLSNSHQAPFGEATADDKVLARVVMRPLGEEEQEVLGAHLQPCENTCESPRVSLSPIEGWRVAPSDTKRTQTPPIPIIQHDAQIVCAHLRRCHRQRQRTYES